MKQHKDTQGRFRQGAGLSMRKNGLLSNACSLSDIGDDRENASGGRPRLLQAAMSVKKSPYHKVRKYEHSWPPLFLEL